ncbi:hypothetical protein ABPG74_013207 [Tetrahymena malaccensis]
MQQDILQNLEQEKQQLQTQLNQQIQQNLNDGQFFDEQQAILNDKLSMQQDIFNQLQQESYQVYNHNFALQEQLIQINNRNSELEKELQYEKEINQNKLVDQQQPVQDQNNNQEQLDKDNIIQQFLEKFLNQNSDLPIKSILRIKSYMKHTDYKCPNCNKNDINVFYSGHEICSICLQRKLLSYL